MTDESGLSTDNNRPADPRTRSGLPEAITAAAMFNACLLVSVVTAWAWSRKRRRRNRTMFSSGMKINEKNVISFAGSDSIVDREGYLSKKNDAKGSQRKWFVLKGNLLFYFEKKQDRDPSGLVILESYSVQASATEKHGFEISFDGPGTRTYVLVADNDGEMQSWMRSISHASYEFLRGIVNELQKQVSTLTTHSQLNDSIPSPKHNEGKVPILPKPKQKVENGVLIDVTEAPPIPPKKKMVVVKSVSPEPVTYHPTAPYTNPVVVPSTGLSLSPPSTMDRTPVMTPFVIDDDDDGSPPPVPTKSDRIQMAPHRYSNTPPTTHSPAIVSFGLDGSSKDAYVIHKELTDVIKGSDIIT